MYFSLLTFYLLFLFYRLLIQPGITTRREIITLVHFGKRVDVYIMWYCINSYYIATILYSNSIVFLGYYYYQE